MGQRDVLEEVCRLVGVTAGVAESEKVAAFLDDLYLVNETRNLTRVPRSEAMVRHVADSLLVVPYLPEGATVLDIGCGPGFPAWVLALFRPDCLVTALDSNQKMTGFLAGHLLPNLVVRTARAESEPDRETYDVVTGRAVAPIGIQAEVSAAWVKVGGSFVPFRSSLEREDVETANLGVLGIRLESVHEVPLPGSDATRLFPVFRKTGPTRPDFPRAWARMKARPLGRT